MIKEGRFLEGVVVSAMYLERYGVDKLQEYFNSTEVPLKPKNIDDLELWKIIELLSGFGIIRPYIRGWMDEVRKERNKIVHELRHPDAIDVNKAKETIEKAIECLQAIGVQ